MLNGEFGMLNSAFAIPHSTFLCQAYFQRLRFVSNSRDRTGPNRRPTARDSMRIRDSNPHYLGPPASRKVAQKGLFRDIRQTRVRIFNCQRAYCFHRRPQRSAGGRGELPTVSQPRPPSSGQKTFFMSPIASQADFLRKFINLSNK